MPTDGLTTYGGQILERFYRQKTTKAEMLKKYQKDCLGFVDSWCLLFFMKRKRSVCFSRWKRVAESKMAAVFTGSHHKAPIGASGCSNAWHGWARMRPADSRTGEAAPWSLFKKDWREASWGWIFGESWNFVKLWRIVRWHRCQKRHVRKCLVFRGLEFPLTSCHGVVGRI